MKSSAIKNTLKTNMKFISTQFHVLNIGLFGSYVRDDQTNKSDIDILVTFKKGHKDFFNFLNLKFYLEELFNINVDLVNKDGIKPALKKRILKQVTYV